ncbi:TRAP transporter large permease subunit [Paracoccus aestuariivivens]|uniref:TRAP transporter large permease protein n=1 Tax=Paracoccus aestuariivivens TaxID=1820333 RepID=A0A6L6JAM4_9RHOB|nr:TRAP transporter large permease subunit [Paracoccus aestuariivivens]MTH79233.1 TRAP transporter large permease subunit [Paracoccus aestuariivivens]
MTITLFTGTLLLVIALGAPIAYALIVTGAALMWQMGLFDGQIIAQNLLNAVDSFPMIAIPLFILAGEVMNTGGLSRRIIALAQTLVGHRRGGLGYVVIFAGVLLSSLSGSALADAASLSALLLPMMVAAGHSKARAGGLIASASIIGPIIPPSIGFIVFGVATNLSISKLFLAGIAPGLMIALALAITWFFVSRHEDVEPSPKATAAERLHAFVDSLWALMLPVIIIVGLRFGIVTPTEAAAVAAAYSLFVAMVVYRELSVEQLLDLTFRAGKTAAGVMFLVAAAAIPAWMITIADIPGQVIALVEPLMDNPKLLVFALMLLIIVVGTAMDLTPTILLLGPILVPVVVAAGVDPIYFGVLFLINCAIGLITPPVGTVLNVVCAVGKINYEALLKGTLPFFLAQVAVLFLLVLFPELITVPATWISH